jgi:hypothetical protein
MTALRIADRPFLRLFEPETDVTTSVWTIAKAFDSFRAPELLSKSRGHQSDARRWLKLWAEFEAELLESLALRNSPSSHGAGDAQRTTHPLRLDQVSSRHLQAYGLWLVERGFSASSRNKAVGEIRTTIERASAEGVPVQTIKTKRQATSARPRYYYDDAAIAKLWDGCGSMTWPPQTSTPKAKSSFRGSGVPPSEFWRAAIILLRNYGMRVQDLVAYAEGKTPITWADVHDDARSPNPDSLECWPLGWLDYTASKTGQRFCLPLTPSARGALDRLRLGAVALHGNHVPASAVVFTCPKSHGLTERFKRLQAAIGVSTRDGKPYELEDFRKTVATYSAQSDRGLPYALCGWGGGGIKERHYQHQEPLLVRKLHRAPLPACFDAWVSPEHTAAVSAWVASEYSQQV